MRRNRIAILFLRFFRKSSLKSSGVDSKLQIDNDLYDCVFFKGFSLFFLCATAAREELSVHRAARFLRAVGIWCMGAGDGMALRGEKKSGPIFLWGTSWFPGSFVFFKYEFFYFFQKGLDFSAAWW